MLVIAVLTIIVVAFLQSMTVEQRTARSYLNKYRAKLAADSALNLAMQKILLATTDNSIVGLDQTQSEEKQPMTVIQLNANGEKTATIPIAVDSAEAFPDKTHSFTINTALKRTASFQPIKLEDGNLQSLAAFYVQPNTAKESLIRFPQLPAMPERSFSTTLQEVPLTKLDKTTYSKSQVTDLNTFVSGHSGSGTTPDWKDLLLTPRTLNQFTGTSLGVDETWTDTHNWAQSKSFQGTKKINLRRLKYYVDGLAVSQSSNNPKAKVVDALLEQGTTGLDPESLWGGGTLKWLVDPNNPDHYTLTEARQIVANLIDYLDADLHPTTDNIDNPTYLGVEGRFESDGTVTGHPYVASLGGGLVFNLSSKGPGNLNSTRVLMCWSLVNPWSHASLSLSGTYSAEFTVEMQGSASGGDQGTDAKAYFGKDTSDKLNERLADVSVSSLNANKGATFPAAPNGLSFANNYSLLNASKQQPSGMTFSEIEFKVTRARLKFTDTNGQVSYVQVIATDSSPLMLPMNPKTFTLPKSPSMSVVYNPQTVNGFVYLKTDPRLNFLADSYSDGKSLSTFSGTNPPKSAQAPDITAKKDPEEWDGSQGMTTDSEWYSKSAASKYFFNRSSPKLTENPAGKQYDPLDGSTEVAVNSIAEIGYLFTGRPWQTLHLVGDATASSNDDNPAYRRDYQLLDFFDSGTMESQSDNNITPEITSVNGKVNINTAPDYVLTSLFKDIPSVSDSDAEAITKDIIDHRNSVGPFIGAGDFANLKSLALTKTDKFEREDLTRRMANLTTTRSNEFTVYAYGEAYTRDRPVANAKLTAVVGLYHDSTGKQRIKIIRKIWN
jgi:type II secretory pathway component PulK